MKDTDLFAQALGIAEPWYVTKVEFDEEKHRLDISIDFRVGAKMPCAECGKLVGIHDTVKKSWRHLNFFQHEAYLHCRVPRTDCLQDGVKMISVPWARPGGGFTLLFEAYLLSLVKHMPVATLARNVGENDTLIWRIVEHYVNKEVAETDLSQVRNVGIDETAARRGHDYVTVVVDLDERKVIHVVKGKDSATIEDFSKELSKKNGAPTNINEVSIDMSPAFISGVGKYLPNASITFDKFHIIKHLNEALAAVWKEERASTPFLKSTKRIWLKKPSNLPENQSIVLDVMLKTTLRTGRAYRLKLAFQELFKLPPELAETSFKRWYNWAIRSRLEPMKKFAKLLKTHWDGILHWFKSGLNNGILEGFNSLIQSTKAKSRGFRTFRYLRLMIFLVLGK
jgi:transposase